MAQVDEFTIEVMPGGVVKITTNPISAANHTSAENLIRDLEKELGGETQINRNSGRRHVHTHNHQHIHAHD